MLNSDSQNTLGLLMISNKPPGQVQMDPRSRSRLNCQTAKFESYTADKLEAILNKRVEQAFRPGTVPSEVPRQIAETVADQSGDCRDALEMLLRAGRKADREGRSEVTLDGF
jgi:cell division control protein 6